MSDQIFIIWIKSPEVTEIVTEIVTDCHWEVTEIVTEIVTDCHWEVTEIGWDCYSKWLKE